jgi:hypothetical protein
VTKHIENQSEKKSPENENKEKQKPKKEDKIYQNLELKNLEALKKSNEQIQAEIKKNTIFGILEEKTKHI